MSDDREIIDVEAEEIEDTPSFTGEAADASTGTSMERWQPAKWSEEWWAAQSLETQARRCNGHRRNGEQCKKIAIRGATVCRTHGGATRHVKRAATTRLENAADRMAKQLLGIATDDQVAPETRLKAIVNALDRSIGRAPTTVEIGPTKAYETVFDDIFSGTRAESRSARGYPDDPEYVAGNAAESSAQRDLTDPTLPYQVPSQPEPQGEDASGRTNTGSTVDAEYGHASSRSDAPRPPQERERGRHRQPQRVERHITGEDAMRLANQANAANAERYGLPWGESAKRR